MMNEYLIRQVKVISEQEEVAYVVTQAGAFIVDSIPKRFTDARESKIVRAIGSYDEAVEWFRQSRGAAIS